VCFACIEGSYKSSSCCLSVLPTYIQCVRFCICCWVKNKERKKESVNSVIRKQWFATQNAPEILYRPRFVRTRWGEVRALSNPLSGYEGPDKCARKGESKKGRIQRRWYMGKKGRTEEEGERGWEESRTQKGSEGQTCSLRPVVRNPDKCKRRPAAACSLTYIVSL